MSEDRVEALFASLAADETPDSVRSRAHDLATGVVEKNERLPLAPGDAAGPYEIVRVLGSGGQAVVYEARHPGLDRRVALKVPRRDVGDRLVREGKLLAALDHPSIVKVHALSLEGPVPFLVLELCEGYGLEERLEVVSPDGLPLEQVRAVSSAVLDALAYAHDRGVVHRDVKPSNVLFDRENRVKVSDFGIGTIARADELSHSVELSQLSLLVGTPLYVAPEQENPALRVDGALDGRADLFSFGKVLFQMLTGASPRTIRPPSRLRPGLDPSWDDYVFRLTEERPERRFGSAREALAALPTATWAPAREPTILVATPVSERRWIGGLRVVGASARRDGLVVTPCFHEGLRQEVTLHQPDDGRSPTWVERFARSSRAALAVDHPNVLRVVDAGTTPDGRPYSAVARVPGVPLAEYASTVGRLDWREALALVTQAARGLVAAHAAKLVLGDVSPTRLHVTERHEVRVEIDLPAPEIESARLEADGSLAAFCAWQAPEWARTPALDARADVYSLGLTFYRLLVGRDPFAGASGVEVLAGRARIPSPELAVPDLPNPVRNVLGKMLEKDRELRYATAVWLLEDLKALEAGRPVSALRPGARVMEWAITGPVPARPQVVLAPRRFGDHHVRLLGWPGAILGLGGGAFVGLVADAAKRESPGEVALAAGCGLVTVLGFLVAAWRDYRRSRGA